MNSVAYDLHIEDHSLSFKSVTEGEWILCDNTYIMSYINMMEA